MIYLLPHIIEQSAERAPDNVVFRFGQDSLRYGEFARRVRCLANFLLDQGVAKGDRVGIYRRKGLESAIAVYGIMAAGGAYVPLDPSMPPFRLRSIIEDCGIRDLIAESSLSENLAHATADAKTGFRSLVGMDADTATGVDGTSWHSVFSGPDHLPNVVLMERDLAYIMYTSGSTGEPKGLMHTHGSGLSYASTAAHVYGVTDADILANHSPLHFDMSTFDYFSGPLRGATTVIVSEQITKLPASMSQLIEDEKITIWYSVPWALIQLLQHGALSKRDLSSLRWVMFGGEHFPVKHLRAIMQVIPRARFSNVYGPAEVNQCAYHHLPELPNSDSESIPIGTIWPNAESLIVDDRDRPVARGQVGELLVRTPTMMSGYWARPDLNRRVFYRAPLSGGFERTYLRTGDLVRQDATGNLWLVGRKDRQVKIRGYRVELDEIEAALHSVDGVMEAAVVTFFDGDATNHIKAAVTLKPGSNLRETEILTSTRQRIPIYAVPQRVAVMDEFPRTASGKIDRSELGKFI